MEGALPWGRVRDPGHRDTERGASPSSPESPVRAPRRPGGHPAAWEPQDGWPGPAEPGSPPPPPRRVPAPRAQAAAADALHCEAGPRPMAGCGVPGLSSAAPPRGVCSDVHGPRPRQLQLESRGVGAGSVPKALVGTSPGPGGEQARRAPTRASGPPSARPVPIRALHGAHMGLRGGWASPCRPWGAAQQLEEAALAPRTGSDGSAKVSSAVVAPSSGETV